jgi:3-hydroxyacyl-CoA dehydrogenase/enoyl-CoA hydratase/3-hydroxybutyryl-CoA epimerase
LSDWLLDRNPIGRSLVTWIAERELRAKGGGHYPAPTAALRAVTYGLRHGIQKGLAHEAQAFADLAVSDTSRKLVQIFFATRVSKRDGDGTSGHPVTAVGVVGAGFMGAAIAGVAATQARVDVRMKDADVTKVARGVDAARRIMRDRLDRRRITRWEYQRLTPLISGGADWAGFRRADLVIEAVFEDLSVKHDVFRELEANTRDDCVLASNTSTIPITRIAAPARRPERIVGMHFFSPVDRMPLLEVIAGERTADQAVRVAAAFGRRMGKTVIVVRDHPGFWINRILAPYLNEAVRLVGEGTPVPVIDSALRRFGFPVGPLALLDEVGIDVGSRASHVLQDAFGARLAPVAGMDGLLKAGFLGRKSGRGFYEYRDGKKRGVNTAAWALLRTDDPKSVPGAPGIETRLVFAMLNEAALALAEGVVRDPRDGDIGAIFGIGFPPFLGGPLRYLDDVGARSAVATLERLAAVYGPRFAPAPLLVSMANSSGRFYPAG